MPNSPRPFRQPLFIFDLNGVLVGVDWLWEPLKRKVCHDVFGQDDGEKIGEVPGTNITKLYDEAVARIAQHDERDITDVTAKYPPHDTQRQMVDDFKRLAPIEVYQEAVRRPTHSEQLALTPGIIEFYRFLRKHGFYVAVVSDSSLEWTNVVLAAIESKFAEQGREFHCDMVLALADNHDLASKPSPDGFVQVMRSFNVAPEHTIVLEDSQIGFLAGKSAKASLVLGMTQHWGHGDFQEGADEYVPHLAAATPMVEQWLVRTGWSVRVPGQISVDQESFISR